MGPHQVISPELARHLTSISAELGRQVGVLIERGGNVRNVIVGDASALQLPEIGRLRGGTGRFRGLRLIHTHLKGEPLSHDDLNDLILLRLDLVAMVEVVAGGWPGRCEAAYLDPAALAISEGRESSEEPLLRVEARTIHDLDLDFSATIQALEEEFARVAERTAGSKEVERALVVGIRPQDSHFEETLELDRSAGVIIAAIHYLLVVFELGVVRDDIRRLAEQVRERGGRGHERP